MGRTQAKKAKSYGPGVDIVDYTCRSLENGKELTFEGGASVAVAMVSAGKRGQRGSEEQTARSKPIRNHSNPWKASLRS